MTFRPPLYMQNSELFSYAAADDRFLIDTLFTEGILNVPAGQGLASQRAEGANMQVYVPPFDAIIDGDDATNQGAYLLRLTAGEFTNVTGAPASGSRIDLLVCEVIDGSYRTPTVADPEGPRLRVIPGTPSASTPTAPALPKTAIPIASITVTAGQATIVNANLTDLRLQSGQASLNVATSFPKLTSTQRDAITSPIVGQSIFNTTLGRNETYLGTTLGWVAGRVDVQTFPTSGTWTKPSGAALVFAQAWGSGAGGSGGRVNAGALLLSGGGGGGGALAQALIPAALLASTVPVTVGAGGSGGTSTGSVASAGLAGSTSSFGTTLVAGGGTAGTIPSSSNPIPGGGGSVGALTTPTTTQTQGVGGVGAYTSAGIGYPAEYGGGSGGSGTNAGTVGGASLYGGSGGSSGGSASSNATFQNAFGPASPSNVFGGGAGGAGGAGGSAPTLPMNGSPGQVPGGGGGSAGNAFNAMSGVTPTGGAGARGEVRVYTICL